MKFYTFFLFAVLSLCLCCKTENKSNPIAVSTPEKLDVNKQILQGSWSLQKSGPVDFKFNDQYFELNVDGEMKSIPYQLNGDSLILLYPEFKYHYKVSAFKGDSIQFMDETSQHTYFKINQ